MRSTAAVPPKVLPIASRNMGLSEIPEQMSYYPTLTREEKARMHPCKKAKCVMMSADSSPTLQASLPSPNYVDLPDEPRPGKITPTTPATNTTNSSPSPRASKSDDTGGKSSPEVDEEEAIEEAVPIVRTTLPSPEPRPLIERNGYKDHDRVDGINGIKQKPPQQHDVDDDSCLIKCVYFTQQCCECTIV
ncbi:hypothetical protein TSAR_000140 [Trichomalopsis sarcophagae]|uniref:Uncharacterized protein n=1 Tax=Trichomalopsis sarcophagae TaxID=543379 RepID=A0A232FCF3_9HYME|nr:hypothetical protein TSAR_000140 [Trichomalopsis sarcophagae]